MKKLFVLSFLLFTINNLLLTINNAHAVEPTISETTAKNEMLNQQINDLKTRIASKVAQLKLVERKGILGNVTEISNTQITLLDSANNIRFVDVDELTKFSSPSAKGTFGISDITKGTTIGALGLYNKESRRILARFVNSYTLPKIIHGAITNVDSDNFTLNVILENQEINLVDVETVTKTLSYTKNDGLTRLGFSKIKEGQRIMVAGFKDVKNKNKITATRIIIFPEIPKNPKITIPEKALNSSDVVTPSTGSGKKLTPIKK